MVDLRLSKSLNRTRASVEGFSASLNSENYTAGTTITIDLTAPKVERTILDKFINYQRAVSKSRYSARDPKNVIYDLKRIIWTWKITGVYNSTAYSNVHNFVVDCKVLFEDGGTFTLTMQDHTYTIIPQTITFTHMGGTDHKVDYMMSFMEGEERT